MERSNSSPPSPTLERLLSCLPPCHHISSLLLGSRSRLMSCREVDVCELLVQCLSVGLTNVPYSSYFIHNSTYLYCNASLRAVALDSYFPTNMLILSALLLHSSRVMVNKSFCDFKCSMRLWRPGKTFLNVHENLLYPYTSWTLKWFHYKILCQ